MSDNPLEAGSAEQHHEGFGQIITWNNGSSSVEVSGFSSYKEAYDKALELALSVGLTKPKWWEFGRRSDRRYFT